MLLVGLKKILSVVKPYEQLDSRSFRNHHFKALEEQEVLSTIFPRLVFPRWRFDPANPEHVQVGKLIWSKVKPSLRLACGVIETGNDIAEIAGAEYVTMAHIEEALKHIRTKGLQVSQSSSDAQSRVHENLSEERHRAKERNEEEDA